MLRIGSLLLSSFSVLFSLQLQAEEMKACAPTQEQALLDLAAQLYVSIENEFSNETLVTNNGRSEKVISEAALSQSVSSSAELVGVSIVRNEEQVCASLSLEQLLQTTASRVMDSLQTLSLDPLANEFTGLTQQLARIADVEKRLSALALLARDAQLLSGEHYVEFERLLQRAEELRSLGAIRFEGDLAAELTLGGERVALGTYYLKSPSQYSYSARFDQGCPQAGEIDVVAGEEQVVKVQQLDLPMLSFIAPMVNADEVKLTVNGEMIALTSTFRVGMQLLDQQCRGTIAWQASYRDQSDSGQLAVSAGSKMSVRLKFTDPAVIERQQKLATSWRKGGLYELGASYLVPHHQNGVGGPFVSTSISMLEIDRALLRGTVVDFARWQQTTMIQLGYHLRFQLSAWGSKNRPFSLLNLPVVPFVYSQAAVGGYQYDLSQVYERPTQTGWKQYVTGALGAGAQWLMNDDFSLFIKGERHFWLDEGWQFQMGLGLHLL